MLRCSPADLVFSSSACLVMGWKKQSTVWCGQASRKRSSVLLLALAYLFALVVRDTPGEEAGAPPREILLLFILRPSAKRRLKGRPEGRRRCPRHRASD